MIIRPVPIRLRPTPSPWRMGQGMSQQQIVDLAEKLRHDGALLQVQISMPGSLQAAGGKGSPQVVKGMVDTGASISTVSEQVAASAGLQQVGSVPLGGVGGSSERPILAAAIGLPEYGVSVDPIEIASVNVPFGQFDMLIGRDILKALHLDYRGPAGAFSLTKDEAAAAAGGAPSGPGSTGTVLLIGGAVAVVIAGALIALDVL